MIISIDISTSYSSVCLWNREGKVQPVETSTGISIYGSKYSLPSAVFVEEDGKVLVGQAAMNSRKKKPQKIKHHLSSAEYADEGFSQRGKSD